MSTVIHYEGLNQSPSVPLAYEGQSLLIKAGLGEDVLTMGWDQNAIVAFHLEHSVGVLVYAEQKHSKSLYVVLSYVKEDHRGKGYFSRMWGELLHQAQAREWCLLIQGAHHVNNHHARAVSKKLGRIETSVTTRYEIAR